MYIYATTPGAPPWTTDTSATTLNAYLALRQATTSFKLTYMYMVGRATSQTSLSTIIHRARRWTTVGTGGTAVTPAPVGREMPAAKTTAVDKQTAITNGTVDGSPQIILGHGLTSSAVWTARDEQHKIMVDADSADEIAFNTICGLTSQSFEGQVNFQEG